MAKNIDIWVAVNKNGTVRIFTDEPIRNNISGKWEGKHPFISSVLQKQFEDLCQKSNITWEVDANPFSINLQ